MFSIIWCFLTKMHTEKIFIYRLFLLYNIIVVELWLHKRNPQWRKIFILICISQNLTYEQVINVTFYWQINLWAVIVNYFLLSGSAVEYATKLSSLIKVKCPACTCDLSWHKIWNGHRTKLTENQYSKYK